MNISEEPNQISTLSHKTVLQTIIKTGLLDTCETSNHCTASDLLPMGISMGKPKYPRYASLQVRVSSYQGWPSSLVQTPREMAQAGFLYVGYQDYTRCFFCGGFLQHWEACDDPWVEHARWFKTCVYLIQCKGDKFVKAVQEKQNQLERGKNQRNSHNSLLQMPSALQSTYPSNISHRRYHQTNKYLDTVAARSVIEMGYSDHQVIQAIQQIMSSNPDRRTISATDIMSVLLGENNDENRVRNRQESSAATVTSENGIVLSFNGTQNGSTDMALILHDSNLDYAEYLVEENRELKDQRLCKICLDSNASIAFLPCGHLVSCTDCAPAMRKCPICRGHVKDTVKTFMV